MSIKYYYLLPDRQVSNTPLAADYNDPGLKNKPSPSPQLGRIIYWRFVVDFSLSFVFNIHRHCA